MSKQRTFRTASRVVALSHEPALEPALEAQHRARLAVRGTNHGTGGGSGRGAENPDVALPQDSGLALHVDRGLSPKGASAGRASAHWLLDRISR